MKKSPYLSRERMITILGFLWLFILMVGYYIIKPVRSALLNELPHESFPYLLIGTMIVILFVNIIYDFLARFLSSSSLIIVVTVFFSACLAVFSWAIKQTWPDISVPVLGLQPGRYILIVAFFLFVGIYNVFIVTVFWSFMNEVFTADEARNFFGKVTSGGTIGGLLGSFITAYMVSRLKIGNLLLFSVVFLLLTLFFLWLMLPYKKQKEERDRREDYEIKRKMQQNPKEISVESESGFTMIFRYSYLRWMVLAMFLMTSTATILTYQMNYLVKYSITDEILRTEFWANINLYINGLGLFFQLFVIHWTVKRFGIISTLLVAPIVDILGCCLFVGSQNLLFGGICHTGRFSTQYSFNKASREMLYTPTSRDFKYQAKAIIDTFVFRAGDGLASLLLIAISSWSLQSLAVLNFIINLFRLIPSIALAREYEKLIDSL